MCRQADDRARRRLRRRSPAPRRPRSGRSLSSSAVDEAVRSPRAGTPAARRATRRRRCARPRPRRRAVPSAGADGPGPARPWRTRTRTRRVAPAANARRRASAASSYSSDPLSTPMTWMSVVGSSWNSSTRAPQGYRRRTTASDSSRGRPAKNPSITALQSSARSAAVARRSSAMMTTRATMRLARPVRRVHRRREVAGLEVGRELACARAHLLEPAQERGRRARHVSRVLKGAAQGEQEREALRAARGTPPRRRAGGARRPAGRRPLPRVPAPRAPAPASRRAVARAARGPGSRRPTQAPPEPDAERAAVRSSSTTVRSAPAGDCSRCALARSSCPPVSLRSSAARRCIRPRSPGGEPGMDGGAQQGMGEPDGVLAAEQVRADELVPGPVGRSDPDGGERRGERQRSLLEHRHSERERLRIGGQRAEPSAGPIARASAQLSRSPRRARRHPPCPPWSASAASSSRTCSGLPPVSSKHRRQKASSASRPPRRTSVPMAAGPSGDSGRIRSAGIRRQRREQARRAPGSPGPGREDDRDRLVGDAAEEVGQQPQRGFVGPVRVVDEHDDRMRAPRCAARPSAAHGGRRSRWHPPRRRRGAIGIHDGAGGGGRTRQQIVTLRRRSARRPARSRSDRATPHPNSRSSSWPRARMHLEARRREPDRRHARGARTSPARGPPRRGSAPPCPAAAPASRSARAAVSASRSSSASSGCDAASTVTGRASHRSATVCRFPGTPFVLQENHPNEDPRSWRSSRASSSTIPATCLERRLAEPA